MKKLLLRGLCLALGLGATTAWAQDTQWRPAKAAPTPAPVASGLSLRTPIPFSDAPTADPAVHQSSFSLVPVARAKQDDPLPAPLPVGSALNGPELAPQPRRVTAPLMTGTESTPGVVSRWTGEEGGTVINMPPSARSGPVVVTPGSAATGSPMIMGGGGMSSPMVMGGVMGPLDGCGCGDGGCGMGGCDTGCCGDACCDSCGCGCFNWFGQGCCPRPVFYASAEYLLWMIAPQHAPPLVTAGPNSQAANQGGVLGVPGTVILYGGDLKNDIFSGGRFTIGFGLPYTRDLSLEGTFFFLGQRSHTFTAGTSTTDQVVARPFTDFDPRLGAPTPTSQLVQYPGLVTGNVTVATETRVFGAEANLRKPLACGCNFRLDGLLGFRYFDLDESLNIREDLVQNTFFGPEPRIVSDRFSTENHFYGGQLGLDGEWKHNRFFIGGTAKVALGSMNEVVHIAGNQVLAFPPPIGTVVTNTGILALGTNSGTFSHDRFAVIPEVGLKVGYQITDNVRAYAGYSFMYVSNVVRPGDAIDARVNTSQIQNGIVPRTLVGSALPAPVFRTSDFWAHGANFGLEVKY